MVSNLSTEELPQMTPFSLSHPSPDAPAYREKHQFDRTLDTGCRMGALPIAHIGMLHGPFENEKLGSPIVGSQVFSQRGHVGPCCKVHLRKVYGHLGLRISWVVECLPNIHEALGLIPATR